MDKYTNILHRCIKKDRKAQMEFYSLFYPCIYNSCLRILNNPMDAEEVMRETFIKFFDHAEAYNMPYPDLERKLRRIAINASIDVLRQQKSFFVPINDSFECEENEDYSENEDLNITIDMIQDAIDQLPNGYKTIINLRLIEDLEFEQIAEMLHITSSTARSQFVRARKKLAILIKNLVYESAN